MFGLSEGLGGFGIVMGGVLPIVQPSLYLGQVATRGRIPTNTTTSFKQFNSRSFHVARDDITSLKIELPNWCWKRSTTGPETNGNGQANYEAAIEYPQGTFTRVLFSGANIAAVASGDSVLSDWCNVTIPNGAKFWVWIYNSGSAGMVFLDAALNSPQCDQANGEMIEYAVSGLTSKVMGGTIIPNKTTADANSFGPTAIVAMTRKASVLFIGDSRVWGFRDTFDTSGDLGELGRSIGASLGYINAGSSGDTLSAFISAHSKRVALQQYCSHVIVQTAINALRSGGSGQNKTAATVLGEQQTILGYFPTKRRFVTTTAPNSTSTDAWATAANQTVNANEAQIAAYNDAIRAGVANVDGYFEIADQFETARNSGKWKFPSITDDGLHALQAGQLALLASGAVDPSRLTRVGL